MLKPRSLPCLIVSMLVLALLSSCKKSESESADVVKLSSEEVTALLGIKEKDGVKVGDIESGKDGVKVKTISFKGGDSTEVEVSDVELRVTSPSKLTYAITYLKVGKLDVLDWKTTQRAQAFNVRVDKPAPGFLSKLEGAISSVRSGAPLKTAELACERLSIDRINYVVRAADASLTKVEIEKLSIVDATSESLGEFSVASAGVGDRVTGKGLKLTKIDRRWADQLLGLLTARAEAERGGPTTIATMSRAATTRPAPAAAPPTFNERLFPFDHFEIAGLDIDLAKLFDSPPGMARVTGVRLDVQRDARGRFAGLAGGADIIVPTAALGDGAPAFFRAAGGPAMEQSLAGTVSITSVRSADGPTEQSTLSLEVPGLATALLSGKSRQLSESLSALLTHQPIPKDYVTLSSISLEWKDEGALAYVLSDRYAGNFAFKEILGTFAFHLNAEAEDDRVRSELASFFRAPKGFVFAGGSDRFLSANDFVQEFGGSPTERQITAFTRRVSFTSKLTDPLAAPVVDTASLQADGAAFKADSLRIGNQQRFMRNQALERFKGWKQAAEKGNATAALLVGACYEKGVGTRADRAASLRWYRQAAEGGDTTAMVRVGERYGDRYAKDSLHDDKEAMRWYQRAADAGDADAMRHIGLMFEDELDREQAKSWHRKAAEAGNVKAMISLGKLCCHYAPLDYREAVKWYQQAVDAGNTEAMRELAGLYEFDRPGVPKDKAEAARWRRKEADATPTPPFPLH